MKTITHKVWSMLSPYTLHMSLRYKTHLIGRVTGQNYRMNKVSDYE